MRREFDVLCRTAGLSEIDEFRDQWLCEAWERISELFVIPSLLVTRTFDSVSDQQFYLLPYDYNGTELSIYYDSRRLDPLPEQSLALKYERRTSGNMGRVEFYDWFGTAGEDGAVIQACTLTNGSAIVQTTSTNTILDLDHWVRFDPTSTTNDPGDYGYMISAGNFLSGTSFQLTETYRGPSGTYTARVRPAEQQQFIVYGIPTASTVDIFRIRYPRRPRRLYNDVDVPEWPSMGMPIVNMAVSIGFEFHRMWDPAKIWWSRAMQRVGNLKQRRKRAETLVTDLTVGSIVGRKTGPYGVWVRHGHGMRPRVGIGR
jgi:hypothetical protein